MCCHIYRATLRSVTALSRVVLFLPSFGYFAYPSNSKSCFREVWRRVQDGRDQQLVEALARHQQEVVGTLFWAGNRHITTEKDMHQNDKTGAPNVSMRLTYIGLLPRNSRRQSPCSCSRRLEASVAVQISRRGHICLVHPVHP